MSKSVIAIFGATGQQGNSTAHFILNDPELSQRYTVRAISRDASSSKMQDLKSKGAQLAQADLDDQSTLPAALEGASFVFFMTTTQYQGRTREIETRQAKAFTSAALDAGVKYIIWSSMSQPSKITNGKLVNCDIFDVKAEIMEHIRSLPIKSAHFAPGSFMQNLQGQQKPRPNPSGDGSFVYANIAKSNTLIPLIDINDTGKWVGAILADPDAYEGKFFSAADRLYSQEEIAATLSKVSGKKVVHVQLPDEVFKGYLPESVREALYEMWVLFREYGYYGANMKEDVEWTRKQIRGQPTSLEEFLVREHYTLE